MILSRYRYRPVTVPLPFLASVTHSPSPFHHRDTPVPHRPSPSLTVPHRPTPSFTVLRRPSPSLTVPHRPSPSLAVPHRSTPFHTVPHRSRPFLDVQHRLKPLFNSLSSFIMVKDHFLNFYHLLRLFFNHFS
jgi:hypothetical protein